MFACRLVVGRELRPRTPGCRLSLCPLHDGVCRGGDPCWAGSTTCPAAAISTGGSLTNPRVLGRPSVGRYARGGHRLARCAALVGTGHIKRRQSPRPACKDRRPVRQGRCPCRRHVSADGRAVKIQRAAIALGSDRHVAIGGPACAGEFSRDRDKVARFARR
jgi:hypothetical protein